MSKRVSSRDDANSLDDRTQADIELEDISFESSPEPAVKSALDEVFDERTVVRPRPKAVAPPRLNEPPPPPPVEVTQWPPKFRDDARKDAQASSSQPVARKPEPKVSAQAPARPPTPEKPKMPPPLAETPRAKPQVPPAESVTRKTDSSSTAPTSPSAPAKMPSLPPLAPKKEPPVEAKKTKEISQVHVASLLTAQAEDQFDSSAVDESKITFTGEIDLDDEAPRVKKKKKKRSSPLLTYPQMALVVVGVLVAVFLLRAQITGETTANKGEVESASIETTEVAVASSPEQKPVGSGLDAVLTQFDESFAKTQSMAAPENVGR